MPGAPRAIKSVVWETQLKGLYPLEWGTANPVAMIRLLRTWLPPVSTCLLLQGAIAGGSILLHRWLVPPTPCCDSLQAR